ncbi:MAG: sodium-dependent transporter [Nitrospinae bacterium]|nr:sodium-dependent transporter [Nitrospinota bacterium]MBI3815481.1 sodium-dependent transporter [Nitrospinota bacterium]
MQNNNNREEWGTRLGLVLALAGNAIGLGNFLRFPVQAAENGGGAFMIPYFISLLLLGIPLMWVELTIGRYGGNRGHGSMPGMFYSMWNNRWSKYIGILGIFTPLIIVIYYTYVESWTLAFSFFSITGKYFGAESRETMGAFLKGFQGIESNEYFSGLTPAIIFYLITLAINVYILSKGVSKGIERLANIAMPLLLIMAFALMVRVLTFGSPDPAHPENNIANGLGFIWNPDFSQLTNATVWLAASGQIFFTLSLGMGAIATYASYMRKDDDVATTGIATAGANEFAEVVLGGTIAIPAAVAFFGLVGVQEIAKGGAFDLGFQSLPVIFQKIPFGQFFGFIWFLLLFFAALTSSVALTQPAMAFLQEEFRIPKERAAIIVGLVLFVCSLPVVLFLKHGFLDELDYWAGTFGPVLCAFLETIIFVYIFGMAKGWEEINRGATTRIPRVFFYIIKYITPLFLFAILSTWLYQSAGDVLLMKNIDPANKSYVWGARIMMAVVFIGLAYLVRKSWRMKKRIENEE